MKIAFLAQSYPPMVSGASLFAKGLAEGMVERGHEVLVIAASDHGTAYLHQEANLTVLRLPSLHNPLRVSQRFLLPARGSVLQALSQFKPELIQTHDPFQIGLAGVSYARRAGVPIILSIHQLPWFVASYISNVAGLRVHVESILWKYARWILGKFSAIITANQTIGDIVTERTGFRPLSISFGLDLSNFGPSPLSPDIERALRHRLGLPLRVPILLYVGRLDTDKRVDRVLLAAAETMKSTDAHLLLIGDGREKSALMHLAKSLRIAERVHFPGFITIENGLPEIYHLATLFVTASEIETQGIVLLEAAASGLPIVAVRATCIPEIVHDGENGLLTDPDDIFSLAHSMTTLIQNPTLAHQMGKAGHRLAQAHDRSMTIKKHEELYLELCVHSPITICNVYEPSSKVTTSSGQPAG